MNYKIDKYLFLNYINNNKDNLSLEEISCLANLYRTYEMIYKATNGKYEENKQKIKRYEDYIYTINNKIFSDKEKIELEIKRIIKKNNISEEVSQEQKTEIKEEIEKINKLKKDDKYFDYIKKRISIIHAKLGIENTFLCASFEAFVELYQNITKKNNIKNNNLILKNPDYKKD